MGHCRLAVGLSQQPIDGVECRNYLFGFEVGQKNLDLFGLAWLMLQNARAIASPYQFCRQLGKTAKYADRNELALMRIQSRVKIEPMDRVGALASRVI